MLGIMENGHPNIAVEFSLDATANPYIGLAGVMAAAHRGLVEHMPLPPAVDVDPASLPPPPRTHGEAASCRQFIFLSPLLSVRCFFLFFFCLSLRTHLDSAAFPPRG